MEGKIIKGVGGNYLVSGSEGVIQCKARGRLRREELTPMVGDIVTVRVGSDGNGSIDGICPRKNFLIRPSVSNIDAIVLVCAAASPEPDLGLIDKLLVIAESKGIEGIVCINKTDLIDQSKAEAIAEIYSGAGYRTLMTCACENRGVDALRPLITGRTVAFAGLSGVGKSSILRLITGRELEIGDVSRIRRGKHTTRHVELIETDGGFVFDTPGFSRLEIDGIRPDELQDFFPEIRALKNGCRFRGCAHIAEPDCVVVAALERGDISQSRYDSYRSMYNTLKNIKEWET